MARKREEVQAKVPKAPSLPSVPKKSRLRDKFPGFLPDIPIPQAQDIPDFDRRMAETQAQFAAMSVPEFIVWDYLTRIKKWRNGIEFTYQLPLFSGRTQFGGFVLDFFIREGQLAWNVQGLRYHLEQSRDRAKVQVETAILTSRGYKVVQLWEDDLIERPTFVLEAALIGQESNRHKDDVGIYV